MVDYVRFVVGAFCYSSEKFTLMGEVMKHYRIGARVYTTNEIYMVGVRHGEDGILYYPPNSWTNNSTIPHPSNLPAFGGEAEIAYWHGYTKGVERRKEYTK